MGRSKEMKLKKATTALAIVFFGVAIAVSFVVQLSKDDDAPPTNDPSITLPTNDDPYGPLDNGDPTDNSEPADSSEPSDNGDPTDNSDPSDTDAPADSDTPDTAPEPDED
jgi:hypothetical protein